MRVIITNEMSVQSIRTSATPKRSSRPRAQMRHRKLLIAFIVFIVAILGFDAWSGMIGLIPVRFETIQNGPTRVIKVPPGGNLQAAIDQANSGDIVELQAGATYSGQINLPNKPLTDYVTIQSSAVPQLPVGKRVSPAQRTSMATITSGILSRPAILAQNGANHYRFVGIVFGPTTRGYFNIVQIGTASETSIEQIPHHIEFDRVYLHGHSDLGQRRGIAANGKYIKITNSYFADFKREGEESQAIAVWGADGPIEISNNYIEAAAEGVLFGGAMSNLGLIPGNAVIYRNWFNKPLEWRNTKWVVKNHLEIKSGQNIKIERNLMTNNWAMGQEGTGVLFTTREDSGKQAVIQDILFANNIMRGAGSAVNIFGGEGRGGRNLTIRNNVFEDIRGAKWDGRGFFIKSTSFDNVVIENNTVIHDGSIMLAYGEPLRGMVFKNNIVFLNEYGFIGDDVGPGRPSLARYFPGAVITNNVIVGGSAAVYGSENFYPSSIGQIGFADAPHSDYRLRGDSPFLKKGSDGNPIGSSLDPKTVGGGN